MYRFTCISAYAIFDQLTVFILHEGLDLVLLFFYDMLFQKNTSTVPERSFAVGTLAEILEACGTASAVFTPHLYPIIMNSMKDEDEEVRSNSVYAMGVIASNGSQVLHTYPL